MTLIPEDGTGIADANSYATVEECDTYHEGHLYPQAWTAASPERKAAALVMASRTINANFTFNGWRTTAGQALEWPRYEAPDPSSQGGTWYGAQASYYAENAVPYVLKAATCEMARELLAANRTADDPSKGIAKIGLGQGALEITFNPGDRKAALTEEVLRLLEPLGTPRGQASGGQAKVVRVQ